MAIIAGMTSGTLLECLLTDVDVQVSRIPAIWILSPIALTVGGGHFPFPDSVRLLLISMGLATMPAIFGLAFLATLRRTWLSLTALLLLTSWFYFGVIHKHFAVLSV